MENTLTTPSSGSRTKFLVGGLLILAAVIYLIVSSTQASAHYFLTVEELKAKGEEMYGRNVRISGAVLGDTIQYDPHTFTLQFSVANVPGSNREIDAQGGLSKVLYEAVNDPNRASLNVIYTRGPKPDLLQHEAQAIMTGKMGEDGIFYADELLLKCPTKYEEAVPGQSDG
jgi:cytochrome c-type biogenesis protein CcmE